MKSANLLGLFCLALLFICNTFVIADGGGQTLDVAAPWDAKNN